MISPFSLYICTGDWHCITVFLSHLRLVFDRFQFEFLRNKNRKNETLSIRYHFLSLSLSMLKCVQYCLQRLHRGLEIWPRFELWFLCCIPLQLAATKQQRRRLLGEFNSVTEIQRNKIAFLHFEALERQELWWTHKGFPKRLLWFLQGYVVGIRCCCGCFQGEGFGHCCHQSEWILRYPTYLSTLIQPSQRWKLLSFNKTESRLLPTQCNTFCAHPNPHQTFLLKTLLFILP